MNTFAIIPKLLLCLALILGGSATLTVAADSDYKVTILSQASIVQPELMTATNLAGKSIVELFGPISEVRVESVVSGDMDNREGKIRQRIDHAKCLGRESDIPWHKVPWVHGHILLANGRILSVDILRSGILVGNLLFDDPPFIVLGGEFKNPGRIPWTNGMTLRDALAVAAFTEFSPHRLRLVHKDGSVEMFRWKREQPLTNNPTLRPGDTVYCPHLDL
jgi:hypothetical protein